MELVAQAFGLERRAMERELRNTSGGGRSEGERRFYTIDLVLSVLREVSVDVAHERALIAGLGRMLTFDALVGAHDRHASNWGVIENVLTSSPARFALIFDTARGLLLRHDDDALTRECRDDRDAFLRRYAS